MIFDIDLTAESIYSGIINNIELYWPKLLWALAIIIVGWFISRWVYLFILYLFKKFNIKELIDKMQVDFEKEENQDIEEVKRDIIKKTKKEIKQIEKAKKRFTEKIAVDRVVAKSISYYIFIVFFRTSISYIGITDIEDFLSALIAYLPSLFIWVLIWFFGIRFANFIYDVVYHALNITKERTSKIIATWAKIIILFFTLMLMLDYIKIVDKFIINTILIWFIAMLSLAWGLAFGLGGRDVAKEILDSFRK